MLGERIQSWTQKRRGQVGYKTLREGLKGNVTWKEDKGAHYGELRGGEYARLGTRKYGV